MPMQLESDQAILSEKLGPEEAFEFFEFLAAGGTKVQLDKVTHLHSAFVQCLMKFRPQLELKETEGFVADLLAKSGLTASKT